MTTEYGVQYDYPDRSFIAQGYTVRDVDVARFWSKVNGQDDPEGCWTWIGCINTSGYGRIKISGKMIATHRFAHEMRIGPIPEGFQIDHLCRNRVCVNPTHLEAVTPRVNTMRSNAMSARNARATHCKAGHEFSPENTRVYSGQRYCHICSLAKNRRRHAKARARRSGTFAEGLSA